MRDFLQWLQVIYLKPKGACLNDIRVSNAAKKALPRQTTLKAASQPAPITPQVRYVPLAIAAHCNEKLRKEPPICVLHVP